MVSEHEIHDPSRTGAAVPGPPPVPPPSPSPRDLRGAGDGGGCPAPSHRRTPPRSVKPKPVDVSNLQPVVSLLLLDEPSTGLAPGLVTALMERLREIQQTTGLTVVMVEQKVRHLLRHADRVYALRLGRIVDHAPARELAGDTERLRRIFV